MSEKNVRIHIGKISETLSNSLDEFQNRLSVYGEIIKPLELKKKPTSEAFYGYLTIRTTDKRFVELRSKYNGANYKGSKLQIDVAKPDYQISWSDRYQKGHEQMNSAQAKRLYQKPERQIDVIPGRLRTSKRKNLKNCTFRMTKNGKSVRITCSKKKLWGFLKDKQLKDLVSQYSKGQWLSGTGDTIETIDLSMLKGMEEAEDGQDEMEDDEEQHRNEQILEKLFVSEKKHDTNEFGEIDMEELGLIGNIGETGGSNDNKRVFDGEDDIEIVVEKEGKMEDNDIRTASDSESRNSTASSSEDESSSTPSSDDDSEEMTSEDAETNSDDAETKKETETKSDDSATKTEDVEMDDGETSSNELIEQENRSEKAISAHSKTTNALREIFNNDDGATFKLFGGEEDEEEVEENSEDQIESETTRVYEPVVTSTPAITSIRPSRQLGLFFNHSDSPFLHSLSQISRLPTGKSQPFSTEKFQQGFWEKRGEMNRDLRRRRRDVLRQIKKRDAVRTKAIV